MKVHVKPLRHRGARLTDYQIHALVPIEGALRLYGIGSTTQLSLSALDDSQLKALLPDLYDVRLVTMHGNGMLFGKDGLACRICLVQTPTSELVHQSIWSPCIFAEVSDAFYMPPGAQNWSGQLKAGTRLAPIFVPPNLLAYVIETELPLRRKRLS